MKRQILFIAFLLTVSLFFIACNKKENTNPNNGTVELFLLESYKTLDNFSCQIDEKTVITKSQPLITYSDFVSYNSINYSFIISDAAKETINGLKLSVFGIAFAIKVNNVLIYTGYFWPGYSSSSCSWTVIDPTRLSLDNVLVVQLGYPGLIPGQVIPDKRNDARILNVFARDNKLIK